ncbi:hypothetical protein KQ51_01430 [Candidatus Izimaplasma bacterium HR1]|jgi:hypothetical protein|uniref:hypothetical protein n=1 Tax=Candidatus Izimoplasma sp. HR1 TaxID=1541959 RepID=UPI0004F7FAC3|nr:hypothetical protein KQ51_01430 [Candidatus Izimaplasma bacterium HR1]
MNRYLIGIRNNALYILLIALVTTLTVLLLVREEKELIIISRDYQYSIYHSDNYESIDIEVLTNMPSSYHFNQDYIIDTKFYNNEEELSISIKDITISSNEIMYQDEPFYQIVFAFKLPFVSNDLLIEMEDVNLEIVYENMEKVSISIGELNYLFKEVVPTSITLSNLSATHEEVNGYNTIGGINLELVNNSSYNIMITDFKLLSKSVYINKERVSTNKTCEYQSTTSSCLGIDYYDFYSDYNDTILNILLGKNNSTEFYLPLLYNNDSKFIYEFVIVIEYEINNQIEVMVIDDFPYMRTSIFNTFNEDDFNVYKFSNTD